MLDKLHLIVGWHHMNTNFIATRKHGKLANIKHGRKANMKNMAYFFKLEDLKGSGLGRVHI